MDTLSEILRPLGVANFARNYKRKRLAIVRGTPDKFKALFDWGAFNAFLSQHHSHLDSPAFRMVKRGLTLPERRYTSDVTTTRRGTFRRLSPDKITALIEDGATAVINAIECYAPPIRKLVRNIAAEENELVQANCYFTPKSSSGFGPHYDSHDVYILQVEGSKEWNIFGTTFPSPLESQPSSSLVAPTEIMNRITTERGDLLYIPRGVWHSASTKNVDSLHLTLGTYRLTRIDLLQWLTASLQKDEEMRLDAVRNKDSQGLEQSLHVITRCLTRLLKERTSVARDFQLHRRRRSSVHNDVFSFP